MSEEKKDSKVIDIKNGKPEMEEVKRILTMDQGAKLIEINTKLIEATNSIAAYQMRINNLSQEKKGMLKAFDLPLETNMHFDEKTFEVKYSVKKEVL